MHWQTSRRKIDLSRPLVMAILNVTPDSFSDGGRHMSVDDALRQAEQLIAEGADIIDIGGESTRPGGSPVLAADEISRTVPVIKAIARKFDIPVSIDTTKQEVAVAAVDAGAEIINDISGLRWDERLAAVAASSGAGLVLMHSRGDFAGMHSQPPVDDVLADVAHGLGRSVDLARSTGVGDGQIVLDIGLGFGKTFEQNLELIANVDRIVDEFASFPVLVGASRKSFIGKVLDGVPPADRLGGSIAAALIAVQKGAMIVRVHDVKPTVAALRVLAAVGEHKTRKTS